MLKRFSFIFILSLTGYSLFAAEVPVDTLISQAKTQFDKKKFKQTLSFCDKALKQAPKLSDAYFWKGRAYEALDKPLDAANEYRAAIMAKKDFIEAQDGLNRVSTQLGLSTP